MDKHSIVLGGGCFWCIEAAFTPLKGILSAVSGYSGGEAELADYQSVCTGQTGHAEVVRLEWDPDIIQLSEILDLFWRLHDPTSLNRQGADVGPQYRSVIFYEDEKQLPEIDASLRRLEQRGIQEADIVTEIKPLKAFYPAEAYHQHYFQSNPKAAYCRMVIAPKLNALKNRNNIRNG